MRSGFVAAFTFAFIISLDELTVALFVTGGEMTTLPKQMWDDSLMKVSPLLAAVASMLLAFMTTLILIAEVVRRRSARAV
jgi:ABC-type spermidine/putrescine transport system permease subunit II